MKGLWNLKTALNPIDPRPVNHASVWSCSCLLFLLFTTIKESVYEKNQYQLF